MKFRIGIDNYGLYPLGLDPMETLIWAHEHKADGVAFSGLDESMQSKCTPDYLKSMAGYAGEHGLYLEWGGGQHIPRDLGNWGIRELVEINRKSAEEANILGTNIIRSCSGGLMRWNPESLSTIQLMEEMAEELSNQLQMLRDYQVVLAIETHFEFTTYELLRVFEWCNVSPGDCLGICLDTMNLLTMLEDPVAATKRVLPWVVSTHIKDGAVILREDGLQSFTCPIGKGVIDLRKIISELARENDQITLSIEDHGGDFALPIFDSRFLQEFPDLSTGEMVEILELARISGDYLSEGKCHILDRGDWPRHCEQRLTQGIEDLKMIANG